MRSRLAARMLTPEVALAYCEEQRSIAVRWQQTAEAMSRACDQERGQREAAEDRIAELEAALEGARQESVQHGATIQGLEESLASLDLEKGVVERRLTRALDEIDRLRRDGGADDDAVRRRVLQKQALRARLGKTDMSPWSRMQTLQQADNAGIELSGDQFDELVDLQLRYG